MIPELLPEEGEKKDLMFPLLPSRLAPKLKAGDNGPRIVASSSSSSSFVTSSRRPCQLSRAPLSPDLFTDHDWALGVEPGRLADRLLSRSDQVEVEGLGRYVAYPRCSDDLGPAIGMLDD